MKKPELGGASKKMFERLMALQPSIEHLRNVMPSEDPNPKTPEPKKTP